MLNQIQGIHHITSIASSPVKNHAFFTQTLGLRLVKKTVNFDNPKVYHLYYGNEIGSPGTILTYFPFPEKAPGVRGVGEVSTVTFSIPADSIRFWHDRLRTQGVDCDICEGFGHEQIEFSGPDGETLRLIENIDDERTPWDQGTVSAEHAIRGLHSAILSVSAPDKCASLLNLMGYHESVVEDELILYKNAQGNQANNLIVHTQPAADRHRQAAGSVHHIAFSVRDRSTQLEVRNELIERGYNVTEVRDRNYFWAIYFKTEDGILFEVATDEPGFTSDEELRLLGSDLKLPPQHEHLRSELEVSLPDITL